MKIFVSYASRDAGYFAEKIYNDLSEIHDIFFSEKSITVGKWNSIIESNISKCDIFVVIVTPGALKSTHVNDEVLQAIRENKEIIPCFYKGITNNDRKKWDLINIYQAIEFENKDEIALKLYPKLDRYAGSLAITNDYDDFGHPVNSRRLGSFHPLGNVGKRHS